MKKINFGDIFEVDLGDSFGYFQYTHEDDFMGYLIRVLGMRFEKRPESIEEEFKNVRSVPTFFPLGAALHRRMVHTLGTFSVTEALRTFPLMRVDTQIPEMGLSQPPLVWDGKNTFSPPDSLNVDLVPRSHIIMFPVLVDMMKGFDLKK